MRVALLVVVTLLSSAAPGSAALRPVDDGSIGIATPSSDGRFIAWSAPRVGGEVHILDTRTGRRRTAITPSGCAFASVGAGRVLWDCVVDDAAHVGRTLDLASGVERTLPAVAPDPLGMADSAAYERVGRRWARVRYTGYKTLYYRYVSLTDGAVRDAPADRRRTADLDAPALVRSLCSPLMRPLIGDAINTFPGPELTLRGDVAAMITLAGARAAVVHVVLERCHRPSRTLRSCARTCDIEQQPVLAGPFVAWKEAGYGAASLHVLPVSGGRARRATLARGARLVGASGRRVYLTEHQRLKHVVL